MGVDDFVAAFFVDDALEIGGVRVGVTEADTIVTLSVADSDIDGDAVHESVSAGVDDDAA